MARDVAALRRRILDASIALVAEQGVRAVSFREVARRARVSHQTPYHHFGDDVGILRAIAREGFAELARAMNEAATAAGDDPHAAFGDAGVAYVRFARTHVGHFRVMFQGPLVAVHDADTPLPEAEATSQTLARLADTAHRAGAGQGMSVETLARLAWSTVHGLSLLVIEGALRAKEPGLAHDDDAIARQVVGGLTHLLVPRVAAAAATKATARAAKRRKRRST